MSAALSLSMLELNWLPALYAHPAHWGLLAPARPPIPTRGQRIVQRVSAALVQAQHLSHRSASQAPAWLRLAALPFVARAQRLGQVALAQRVRHALDRRAVLHSVELLGDGARSQAYEDMHCWPALSASVGADEPLPVNAEGLAALGGSVMAALLESEQTGQRERLLLRFAPGQVVLRALDAQAMAEANILLQLEFP